MKFSRTILGLALCSAPVSSAVAQTNNGFVGVFGDAAATIRCMQAAPGVPMTLYVVASTAGTTANGITGAEFRIEFTNPSGYFISYTAPSGAQALGDPLSSTGFNIAWPSCQVPTNDRLQLGTVMVFNAGSGGQTDIIVKRKNPPSNASYPCALFVQCDSPVYTKSCMTAPLDSVSCLTQKAATLGPVLSEDEFKTTLEGSGWDEEYREYEGYSYYATNNIAYDLALGKIGARNPDVSSTFVAAWVGLGNGAPGPVGPEIVDRRRWLQAGWDKDKSRNDTNIHYYYEVMTDVGHIYTPVDGTVADNAQYSAAMVKLGTDYYAEITVNGTQVLWEPWSNYFTQFLRCATFTVEAAAGGDVDHTPGIGTNISTPTNGCLFSNAGLRRVGVSEQFALIDFDDPEDRCEILERAANSSKKSDGLGRFVTWYFP